MYNKRLALKTIRREMQTGQTLEVASKRAGLRSSFTLHTWRKRWPRINRFIEILQLKSNDTRVDAVENAFTKMLIDGHGSAAAYAFYLTNRAPQRWKALKSSEINPTFINKNEQNFIKELTTDELRDAIALAKEINRVEVAGA